MVSPDVSAKRLGYAGELLVQSRLLTWNYDAVLVSEDNPYDILVMTGDKLLKVQVKTTAKECGVSYRFTTSQGAGNSKSVYKASDYDIIALVAMDVGRVLFQPISQSFSLRKRQQEFTLENELASWKSIVEST